MGGNIIFHPQRKTVLTENIATKAAISLKHFVMSFLHNKQDHGSRNWKQTNWHDNYKLIVD